MPLPLHALATARVCATLLTVGRVLHCVCVCRYDSFLYGDRLDGVFASTAYFLPKAVGAFANALPLTIVYSIGFIKPLRGCPASTDTAALAILAAANVTCTADDTRIQPQPDVVVWGIRLCTGLLPAVASMAALCFKFAFYLYPTHMPDIQEGIKALKANPTVPVKDPATGQSQPHLARTRTHTHARLVSVSSPHLPHTHTHTRRLSG